ncbi:MAG: hypothetical protein AAF253_05530, partial [Pseudomonadota bacterium]
GTYRMARCCVSGIAMLTGLGAQAQVEIGGIGDVDPFGSGYLEDGETAMPTDMWKASRTDDLLPLMEKVRTSPLTPAERSLLRRVVLSPAARPAGENAAQVLAQRARIMFEIGEAEAAADLLGRLEENPSGLDAEALSVDLQLALGNNATACSRGEGRGLDGAFWAKLRTVCALLQDDAAGAELAAEIAGAQGVDDDWFYSAVFAATTDDADAKPDARYDSGLNLALSEAAELAVGDTFVASSRGDLAAAMARRESLPIGQRVQAAGIAAEAELVDADLHRALYDDLLAQDTYQASRPIEAALAPGRVVPATAQTIALPEDAEEDAAAPSEAAEEIDGSDSSDAEADIRDVVPALHADYLESALASATGDAARFAAVSRLLKPELETLQRSQSTAPQSLVFARAAIAAGDPSLAGTWHRVSTIDGAPEPDEFEHAWTQGLILLARGGVRKQDAEPVADAIAAAADTSGKQRAAAQLFAAWTALDIATSAEARAMLMALDAPEREINEWQLLSIGAAAEADGAGEVVLSVIGMTGGDPAQLAPLELIVLIEALRDIDAADAARTLALEATGYWKTLR